MLLILSNRITIITSVISCFGSFLRLLGEKAASGCSCNSCRDAVWALTPNFKKTSFIWRAVTCDRLLAGAASFKTPATPALNIKPHPILVIAGFNGAGAHRHRLLRMFQLSCVSGVTAPTSTFSAFTCLGTRTKLKVEAVAPPPLLSLPRGPAPHHHPGVCGGQTSSFFLTPCQIWMNSSTAQSPGAFWLQEHDQKCDKHFISELLPR